jgi:hypothetical protein
MNLTKITKEVSNQIKKNKRPIIYALMVITLLYIIYCKFIKDNKHNNALNLDAINIENFDSSNTTQNGNIIYHFDGDNEKISSEPTISSSVTNVNDDKSLTYTIELGKKYKITDFYLNKINENDENIKIGVFNSSNSELFYVNLNPTENDMEKKIERQTSGATITEYNIKDIYNNDMYGDKLIIYIKNLTETEAAANAAVKNGSAETEPETEPETENLTETNNLTVTVCGISNDENIHENEMEYLVDKTNDITNIEVAKIDTFTDPDSSKPLYKVTYIEFTTSPSEPFEIVYTNPYTEEVMVYKSDRSDGKFIITDTFRKILCYDKILLANSIQIKQYNANGTVMDDAQIAIATFKGYKANVNDINQFKLENNLTDIRGSINPNDICPSIDNLIQGQLNAETIIDAMDNQEKIKDEKIKLQSRKEALLTLLEQKEDISRLGNMLDSIETITKKRNMDTDVLNAIKFTKQMDEVSKLKEVLDARIKYNEDNTLNIDKVNLNIYREPTEEELQLYNQPSVSEVDTSSGSGTTVVDEFVDISPKLPIEEEMQV